jgi:hypothetical protein
MTENKFSLPISIAFIDCRKAFSRLEQNKLWEKMFEKEFPDHIIRIAQHLYVL